MAALNGLLAIWALALTPVLRAGRWFAVVAIGLMTLIILLQVFCRYVLGSALPWPDEAARFLMLWMTAAIAPSAYRWGGFVSIDMVSAAMPRRLAALLALALLMVAMATLVVGIWFGWKHVSSGWLFASSTLRLPLDVIGMKAIKIKLAWMYMSLLVGVILLAVVNVELMLKALIRLIDPSAEPPEDPDAVFVRAD